MLNCNREDVARPFTERLLDHLQVTYRVAERDLAQIPRKGPTVVVVNHPFGILEGAVLATILPRDPARYTASWRIVFCPRLPEMRDLLVSVDPMGGESSARGNRAGLRQSIEHLQKAACWWSFPLARFRISSGARVSPTRNGARPSRV
jgi:putative hemolysin